MAAMLPMPRYGTACKSLLLISMIWPGASGHPANSPPHTTPSAKVNAFTMSPDLEMPPVRQHRCPRARAAGKPGRGP